MSNRFKIVSLFATIGWLAFSYMAFKGLHLWYWGFASFFWLTLSSLNYRYETSLWLIKNKTYRFLRLYIIFVIFFFFIDFIIALNLTNLWQYPYYKNLFHWGTLYLVLYPLFAFIMLELVYFVAGIFGEKLRFVHRPRKLWHYLIDKLDLIFLLLIFLLPITNIFSPIPGFTIFIVWVTIIWGIIATLKFKYHIQHWGHYTAIFIAVFIIAVLLNEIPNTVALEWVYNKAPIFNQIIFGVPLWVIMGWYISVLFVLRFWIYFVLKKRQD